MPLQFGNSDDCPKEKLVRSGSVRPIVSHEVIERTAPGFMNWEERLRTTEEMLQKLSGGYPFAWNGDGQPLRRSSPCGADPVEGPNGVAVRE